MVFMGPPFENCLIFRTEAITVRPKFFCIVEVEHDFVQAAKYAGERENE